VRSVDLDKSTKQFIISFSPLPLVSNLLPLPPQLTALLTAPTLSTDLLQQLQALYVKLEFSVATASFLPVYEKKGKSAAPAPASAGSAAASAAAGPAASTGAAAAPAQAEVAAPGGPLPKASPAPAPAPELVPLIDTLAARVVVEAVAKK
jgi:hypothetical protein